MGFICLITWLTESCMVVLMVDCRREKGSLGMVNGGLIGDGKVGIMKFSWGTNPYAR